jgi:hypothetical protein
LGIITPANRWVVDCALDRLVFKDFLRIPKARPSKLLSSTEPARPSVVDDERNKRTTCRRTSLPKPIAHGDQCASLHFGRA